MFNQLDCIGNLTRDWETAFLPNGTEINKSAIATSHKYKMQDGSQKEEVMFMDISIFGKGGNILKSYTRKGSKLFIQGRVILEQWNDQASGAKRSKHTLRVENFKFLDSKQDGQSGGYAPQQQQGGYNQNAQPTQQRYEQNIPTIDIDNDEIPF